MPTHRDYDVAPNGRLLMAFASDTATQQAYIDTGWAEDLNERVPADSPWWWPF